MARRLTELGLWGDNKPNVLADYLVHAKSMLRVQTDVNRNKQALITDREGATHGTTWRANACRETRLSGRKAS